MHITINELQPEGERQYKHDLFECDRYRLEGSFVATWFEAINKYPNACWLGVTNQLDDDKQLYSCQHIVIFNGDRQQSVLVVGGDIFISSQGKTIKNLRGGRAFPKVTVMINSKGHQWMQGNPIRYDDIAQIAGKHPSKALTITVKPRGLDGTMLHKGESVEAQDGLSINCQET